MRRALRRQLPWLAYHFGLHPDDLDRMPYGELWAFLDALKQINDAARNASRSRGRR